MTAKIQKIFALMAAALLFLAACDHFSVNRGSGNLITETHQVSGFTKVEFAGVREVEIVQDGTESLVIETDDDVMEHITTEVRDATLYVSQRLGSPTPTKLKITLHVNELTGISIPGRVSVRADSLKTDTLANRIEGVASLRIKSLVADELTVVINGVGDVKISGSASSQTVVIGGTGTYHAGDLQSESASLVVSGSGDVTLWVTKILDVVAQGTCTVDYYGLPEINIAQARACQLHTLGDK